MNNAVQAMAAGELMQSMRIAQIAIDNTILAVTGGSPVDRYHAVAACPQPSGDRPSDQAARPCNQMRPHTHRQLNFQFKKCRFPHRSATGASIAYGRNGMAMGRIGDPVAPRNRMQAPKKANS